MPAQVGPGYVFVTQLADGQVTLSSVNMTCSNSSMYYADGGNSSPAVPAPSCVSASVRDWRQLLAALVELQLMSAVVTIQVGKALDFEVMTCESHIRAQGSPSIHTIHRRY